MKMYVVALAVISLLAVSCKSKKETVSRDKYLMDSIRTVDSLARAASEANTIAVGEPNPATPAPSANDSIRLNVSFYSPGSGINYRAAKSLNEFLTKYDTENPGAITTYKSAWGREGEVDYCFKVNDKSKGEGFVKQVMDLLKGQDRINYTENTTCRKPRW